MKTYDTIIIGGGQAGLSVAYFLRRKKLQYLILDDQSKPGGSWQHTWDSLHLFSPTEYSSLSGWGMPKGEHEYPTKKDFINYLKAYEAHYDLPVNRNVHVIAVHKTENGFNVETNKGNFYAKTVVSCTGSAQVPFIPAYIDANKYKGIQIHSYNYKNPKDYKGMNVLVVGGGNSAAQILAEVSKVAKTTWVTLNPPSFLPDNVDGRYLFNEATDKFYNKSDVEPSGIKATLSEIVMIDTVKDARACNVLNAQRPFSLFYEDGVEWKSGEETPFDAVIWCTGFRANLKHLEPLNIIENTRVETKYTRAIKAPGLWLVGYGNWTGYASATIYGVGKTARRTVEEISDFLLKNK